MTNEILNAQDARIAIAMDGLADILADLGVGEEAAE